MPQNRLRILYICGDTNLTGGIEKYNRDFLNAITLADRSVYAVIRKAGGWHRKAEFAVMCLLSAIKLRPDYIICGHLNFAPVVLFLNLCFRVPYSINLYGIEVINIKSLFSRLAVKKAQSLIVISDYTKGLLLRQFEIDQAKIFMLISSVDESLFFIKSDKEELKRRFGLQGKRVILTLSRLSSIEQKGQHRVLEAMPIVLKSIPNACYVLAGPGKDIRVESVLETCPQLSEHFLSLGRVNNDEQLDLYNLADVFVLPSKNEGFAIVSIEALACGTPVIVSREYGGRRGIRDGRFGHLINPDVTEDIANKIIVALRESEASTIADRQALRKGALKIYGYKQWCRSVNKFLEGLEL